MQIESNEVREIVQGIWSCLLNWQALPASEHARAGSEEFLTGSVSITGAWTGAVVLDSHVELARRAAARMFDLPPEEVDPEMLRDALGELTNLLGGKVKALFGGTCHLGLPAVVNGRDYAVHVPGGRTVLESGFRTQDLPFAVRVLQRIVAENREPAATP